MLKAFYRTPNHKREIVAKSFNFQHHKDYRQEKDPLMVDNVYAQGEIDFLHYSKYSVPSIY